jgi:molecular chaperone HscB
VNSSTIQNFFTLLGLPVACDVDERLLETNYKQRQAEFHPDRFAGAGAASRLRAVQQASLFNEAYTTLKVPLHRAEHLLQLHGVDTQTHDQADMDGAFLLMQMELRENLEVALKAKDLRTLEELRLRVRMEFEQVWNDFTETIGKRQFQAAKPVFHKLQFLSRLDHAISEAEEKLLDY